MAASKEPPHSSPSAQVLHLVACPSTKSHILRERISQQLAELAAKEKELVDLIHGKRLHLNRLWNASLLVHRLPNELLVQVFTYFPGVAWIHPRAPSWLAHCDRASDRVSWYHFMLVCQHWRAIFVSTPTFWRKIDLKRHIEWTNLCLTRSVAASLDVSIGSQLSCPLEVLHRHAHRFRTLRFDTPQVDMALAPLFKTPMPLLEDLHLDIQPEAKPDIQLTSQRFPRLRALTLCWTHAPQDTSLFAQLRVVWLSSSVFDFSFDSFLDMLAASVHLEELSLRATLSYSSDEWVHDGPVPRRPLISLPRLRKLTVAKHGVARTSCFLAHLCLPPSASLLVEADYATEPSGTQSVSSVSEMLPPNRAAVLPILATATKVELMSWQEDYEISCKPLLGTVPRGFESTDTSFTLSSSSDGRDWDPFIAHGLADLVECFGQAPVTCLTVLAKHDYGTTDAWEGVFRAFPRLEFLTVGGAYDSCVTSAFRGLHAASTRTACVGELPALACRNLKEVQVDGLGLMETYAAMEECFRYRGEKGVVLQVLNFKTWFDEDGGATRQERQEFVDNLCEAVEYIELLRDSDDSESEESDGTV